MLIGINGLLQSGKDTVANYLVENYGFKKYSLADPVRDSVLKLNPYIDAACTRLIDIVEEFGWDKAKVLYPEVRRLLQVFGTQVGRQTFGDGIWLQKAKQYILSNPPEVHIVIPDIRFNNEAEFIHAFFGQVIKIERPGIKQMNHVSEAGINPGLVDYVFCNCGTLEDLYQMIDKYISRIEKI